MPKDVTKCLSFTENKSTETTISFRKSSVIDELTMIVHLHHCVATTRWIPNSYKNSIISYGHKNHEKTLEIIVPINL